MNSQSKQRVFFETKNNKKLKIRLPNTWQKLPDLSTKKNMNRTRSISRNVLNHKGMPSSEFYSKFYKNTENFHDTILKVIAFDLFSKVQSLSGGRKI